MTTKTCSRCKMEKPTTDFSTKGKNKFSSECKICHNLYNKSWYKRNKESHKKNTYITRLKERETIREYMQIIKSKPCLDCNKSYPPYVMDFDHREPAKKKTDLAHMVRTYSLKAVKAEIAKCDLVCSNCHRERTFNSKNLSKQL